MSLGWLREAVITLAFVWMIWATLIIWVYPIWRDRPVVVWSDQEQRWKAQRDLRRHPRR